eukprot:Skav204296  [mRNA]  locus=scaffold409:491296:494373:- [translate_table: standard]
MPAAQQYICDIGQSGNLLEFGLDPFYRPADSKSLGVQTEFKDSPQLSPDEEADFSETVSKPAAASQILRFAIGLLGLEIHEKPSQWSETWLDALSFWSDRQFKKGQAEWQKKVLDHLRQLFPRHGGSKEMLVVR